MADNRQYELLLRAAKDKLKDAEPENIAKRTGFEYDAKTQRFTTVVFGTQTQICWPDLRIEPELPMWIGLILFQYMETADAAELSGQYMALHEFRDGGLVRGSSFDAGLTTTVQSSIGKWDAEKILHAASAYGGVPFTGNADVSLEFHFLPRYPIHLLLWLEDDEFPAACKVLFDHTCERWLEVEAAGTLAASLLALLEGSASKGSGPSRKQSPPPTG